MLVGDPSLNSIHDTEFATIQDNYSLMCPVYVSKLMGLMRMIGADQCFIGKSSKSNVAFDARTKDRMIKRPIL